MFDDIEIKLKNTAKIIFIVALIFACIIVFACFITSINENDGGAIIAGLIIALLLLISCYITSLLIYGFGELIEYTKWKKE